MNEAQGADKRLVSAAPTLSFERKKKLIKAMFEQFPKPEPRNNALVRLRSSIAVRSFLSALARSSWELGDGMTEKHRVLLPVALRKFSQAQAVIGGGALSRSSKFNDFSV